MADDQTFGSDICNGNIELFQCAAAVAALTNFGRCPVMGEFITVADILAACSDGRGRARMAHGLDGGMCRCPAHDDRSPSLSVREGDRGLPIVIHCFAGCEFKAIRDRLVGLIGKPWPTKNAERAEVAAAPKTTPEATQTAVLTRLEELGAQDSIKGALAEQYLIGRGIGAYTSSRALRYVFEGPSRGMLVSLIHNATTGRLQSFQTTSLYRHPSGKVVKAGELARRFPAGFPVQGGVIPLNGHDEPEEVVIGEGMETSASAGILFDLPAWAAISSGNLKEHLTLPPYVKRALIAADNDASGNGRRAARAAYRRWEALGIKVEWELPDLLPGMSSTDFNDILLHELTAKEEAKRHA